jgi:hypothetical protein
MNNKIFFLPYKILYLSGIFYLRSFSIFSHSMPVFLSPVNLRSVTVSFISCDLTVTFIRSTGGLRNSLCFMAHVLIIEKRHFFLTMSNDFTVEVQLSPTFNLNFVSNGFTMKL